MKILVIGGGAREHAIAEALHRSAVKPHIIVSPGNPGIAREFETVALDSFQDIEDYCIIEGVDMVFVGPEKPLAEGLADHLRSQRIAVVGPSKAAARIESSKSFAKKLMTDCNVPTARYEVQSEYNTALAALANWTYPVVIKVDGLAAGKGVKVCQSRVDAEKAVQEFMNSGAGNTVVIEEFLQGWEVSLFAFSDGTHFQTSIFCQDHKQLMDGDMGPNTGGMGAYAPVPEAELYRRDIESRIIAPVLDGLRAMGCPFQGVLYAGLMITKNGPYVVEFNCRLGDPEAQTILPLLETDFVELSRAMLNGTMDRIELKWLPKTAVCVVATGKEYPYQNSTDLPISFSDHVDAHTFFGGVSSKNNILVTNGGRILTLTAVGLLLTDTRKRVYHDISKVFFDGMHYRTDIGMRDNHI